MLSHELRDPLGAVVTATALLRGAQCPEEKRPRLLAIVERQSQQMARLLDDLLKASRVTQNKIELRRTRVDRVAVTRDAAEAVRNVMDARKMDFSLDLESEPLWVDGDTARLRQTQANLLNNAAKYTHVGSRVCLTARRSGSHAVVVVIDDGAGIPESMLENVFDLFVKSKRTLDRSDGGLGVGLTLVRTLVAMHGGTVTARSKGAGYGSEFTVSLPLATVLTEEEPAVSSHHLRVGAPRRRAGKRVAAVCVNALETVVT